MKVTEPKAEIKAKELLSDVSTHLRTKEKSEAIVPRYEGTDKNGVVYFTTNSGTKPGLRHHQKIELLDLKKAIALQKKDKSLTNRDVVNLSVFGDIKVWCSDASFRYYGWQYITWNIDAGIEPEMRPPTKRNPHLSGSICKHLVRVLQSLPFHISNITRDLIANGTLSPLKNYNPPTNPPPPTPTNLRPWRGDNITK